MTTDLFYPDRSQFQDKTRVSANAITARATEGDWLTDWCYAFNKDLAASQNAGFQAYHFLEEGSSAAAQAQHCLSVVGTGIPLMLDLEPIAATSTATASGNDGHYCGQAWFEVQAWHAEHGGARGAELTANQAATASYISKPSIQKAVNFVDAYRADSGICHTLYLPHWYWQVLGQPSLQPFIDRHMTLVSSYYVSYSDTGPGWQPYGGMTPKSWQYTSTGPGSQDWNCYKSDTASSVVEAKAELINLWRTGSTTVSTGPTRHVSDGTLSLHEAAVHRSSTAAHLAAV